MSSQDKGKDCMAYSGEEPTEDESAGELIGSMSTSEDDSAEQPPSMPLTVQVPHVASYQPSPCPSLSDNLAVYSSIPQNALQGAVDTTSFGVGNCTAGHQPAIIFDQTPLPKFVGPVFGSIQELEDYLRTPAWKPTLGMYGKPMTGLDIARCVHILYDALVDVESVWDEDAHPECALGFVAGGDWSNQKDLQAIAVFVLHTIFRVHSHGLAGLVHHLPNAEHPKVFDQLQHPSASPLDGPDIVGTIAKIWTVLSKEQSFKDWWNALPDVQMGMCLLQLPYADVMVNDQIVSHPTTAEALMVWTQI
ncbi:hypothetical protein EK21DRAFT_112891 [Setomelanomma holmii]|uniref:Uncharacterized protein n=1 Tax=Setomelanomma holmii TaxID=210430 RepID=A0A9P4LN35_9PLEO|nr:hypothetical protein EK21DRAFT_112891 [Setomelanomma holmii]